MASDAHAYSSNRSSGNVLDEDLASQRRASSQRVLAIWDSLERRYSRSLADDDIVDLESMTVIRNAGNLSSMPEVPYGSLNAAQTDADSSDEDDEDELGIWDDVDDLAAQFPPVMPQPPRLSEDDERDLELFLQAEEYHQKPPESYELYYDDSAGSPHESSPRHPTPALADESDDELAIQGPLHQADPPVKHVRFQTSEEEIYSSESQGKDSDYDDTQHKADSSSDDELAASDDNEGLTVRPVVSSMETPIHFKPSTSGKFRLSPPRPHSLAHNGRPNTASPVKERLPLRSGTPGWKQPTHDNDLISSRAITKPSSHLGKRKRGHSPLHSHIQDPFFKSTTTHRSTYMHKSEEYHSPSPWPSTSQSSHLLQEDSEEDSASYGSPDPLEIVEPVPYRQRTPGHTSRPQATTGLRTRETFPPEVPVAELNQLRFHLQKVNEWAQKYQLDDLNTSELAPFEEGTTPRRAHRPSNPEYNDPHNRLGSVPSSVSSHKSAMRPPPTPTRLFNSSPIKPSGGQGSSSQNTNRSRSQSRRIEPLRYGGGWVAGRNTTREPIATAPLEAQIRVLTTVSSSSFAHPRHQSRAPSHYAPGRQKQNKRPKWE